jgi:hypothetical protein
VERTFFVLCGRCCEHAASDVQHLTSEIKVINVEEDISGRDVVSFECPITNRVEQSLVYGGDYV